jgi:tagaturonate epimerase
LLHVAFKIAGNTGCRYLDLLEANEDVIARNITHILYARHIGPVVLGLPL